MASGTLWCSAIASNCAMTKSPKCSAAHWVLSSHGFSTPWRRCGRSCNSKKSRKMQVRRDRGECIMPYKPNWNVVRAESIDCRRSIECQSAETHESELPDDLQSVADQLTDDAQHLESR